MNVLPFFYFQILMILRAKSTLDAVIRPHYNLIASLFYQFLLVELRAGVVALKTNMALRMPVPGQNDMLKMLIFLQFIDQRNDLDRILRCHFS